MANVAQLRPYAVGTSTRFFRLYTFDALKSPQGQWGLAEYRDVMFGVASVLVFILLGSATQVQGIDNATGQNAGSVDRALERIQREHTRERRSCISLDGRRSTPNPDRKREATVKP